MVKITESQDKISTGRYEGKIKEHFVHPHVYFISSKNSFD
jgi:hypothetical protein